MSEITISSNDRKIIDEAVENIIKETKREIALEMKADGVRPSFIFKYLGIVL